MLLRAVRSREVARRLLSTTAASQQQAGEAAPATLFYEQSVSTTTSEPREKVVQKYCKIGDFLLDQEIPRQFERTEWNRKMHRHKGLTPEQLKQARERVPDRGGRWDMPELVESSDMHLMLRDCGVQLCKDLEQAGEKNSSFARILTGDRGVGKSATLIHALTWARTSGWLTMYMPRASNLVTQFGAFISGTGGPIALVPGSTVGEGLFQQPNAAQEILQATADLHGEILAMLPQRRKYKHDLYSAKQGQKSTLAHILMRGLGQPQRASDALFDLRLEFNLIEEVPVLIAVDEFNALYWPTALYFQGKSVKAHELVVAKAFRFVDHVPGDIEDDSNPRTPRQASLNPAHLPKRGAVIGAPTRSLEASPHKEQIAPARFEEFRVNGVDYQSIPRYSADELATALSWYQMRGTCRPHSLEMLGKARVYTAGNAERVAQYALGSTMAVEALATAGEGFTKRR